MAKVGIAGEIIQLVKEKVSGDDIEVEEEDLIEELFALIRTKLEGIANPRGMRAFWDPFEKCRQEAVALFTTKVEPVSQLARFRQQKRIVVDDIIDGLIKEDNGNL